MNKEAGTWKRKRLLLADDHALVRAGIRKALEALPNIEIVGEVGDGPTLFATLAETEPDCLLMDVTMPDFDPIAAIQLIRARYPTMKILAVSAYDDDVYVQGLLRVGVNGYHLKDQSLENLRLAVKCVLAGERWLSSPLINKLLKYSDSSSATAQPKLTKRQRQILRSLQQGLDNQTIAQQMGLSVKTIENHLTRIYRKLNVQSRLEAVSYAIHHPEVLGLPKSTNTPSAATWKAPEQNPITILLVDDNPRYRRQLRRMTSKACPQATIYEAGNIKEVVHVAQRIRPQLALIDVVLGEENGIHCTQRLKIVAPEARIILISAYPDREFHRRGLEAGAVAFLDKKDLDINTLRQVIDDAIA
ncbi:MAG: response regulator [Ardenticatenaceae bacterium]